MGRLWVTNGKRTSAYFKQNTPRGELSFKLHLHQIYRIPFNFGINIMRYEAGRITNIDVLMLNCLIMAIV